MAIKSNIQKMALAKGMTNPQDLSHELRVSWPTAKQLWQGNIEKTWLTTLLKVAALFSCNIDDLFETSENETSRPERRQPR